MSGFELNTGGGIPDQESSTGPESEMSDLGSGFLKNVDEADREVVAKYLKDWDAGVTKRFQNIHNEYEWAKEYDPDSVSEAMNLVNLINEDPGFVMQQLYTATQNLGLPMPEFGQQQQYEESDDGEYAQIPPELQNRLDLYERGLTEIISRMQQQDEYSVEQEEDEMLSSLLDDAHRQHGEFDEDWVLLRMANNPNLDIDSAVGQYTQWVQGLVDSRTSRPRPAPVMGRGGVVPTGGVDPSKMNRSDTKNMVVQMLQAAQNQT